MKYVVWLWGQDSLTNEIRLDGKEEFISIVEPTGQCVSRRNVAGVGALPECEVFGSSKFGKIGKYCFLDGITFDASGNSWKALVMSGQIYAITLECDY